MLPAALVSWIYAEHYAMIVLLICTALTGSVGVILYFAVPQGAYGHVRARRTGVRWT